MSYWLHVLLQLSAGGLGAMLGCWIFDRFLRKPSPVTVLLDALEAQRKTTSSLWLEQQRMQREIEAMRHVRLESQS